MPQDQSCRPHPTPYREGPAYSEVIWRPTEGILCVGILPYSILLYALSVKSHLSQLAPISGRGIHPPRPLAATEVALTRESGRPPDQTGGCLHVPRRYQNTSVASSSQRGRDHLRNRLSYLRTARGAYRDNVSYAVNSGVTRARRRKTPAGQAGCSWGSAEILLTSRRGSGG